MNQERVLIRALENVFNICVEIIGNERVSSDSTLLADVFNILLQRQSFVGNRLPFIRLRQLVKATSDWVHELNPTTQSLLNHLQRYQNDPFWTVREELLPPSMPSFIPHRPPTPFSSPPPSSSPQTGDEPQPSQTTPQVSQRVNQGNIPHYIQFIMYLIRFLVQRQPPSPNIQLQNTLQQVNQISHSPNSDLHRQALASLSMGEPIVSQAELTPSIVAPPIIPPVVAPIVPQADLNVVPIVPQAELNVVPIVPQAVVPIVPQAELNVVPIVPQVVVPIVPPADLNPSIVAPPIVEPLPDNPNSIEERRVELLDVSRAISTVLEKSQPPTLADATQTIVDNSELLVRTLNRLRDAFIASMENITLKVTDLESMDWETTSIDVSEALTVLEELQKREAAIEAERFKFLINEIQRLQTQIHDAPQSITINQMLTINHQLAELASTQNIPAAAIREEILTGMESEESIQQEMATAMESEESFERNPTNSPFALETPTVAQERNRNNDLVEIWLQIANVLRFPRRELSQSKSTLIKLTEEILTQYLNEPIQTMERSILEWVTTSVSNISVETLISAIRRTILDIQAKFAKEKFQNGLLREKNKKLKGEITENELSFDSIERTHLNIEKKFKDELVELNDELNLRKIEVDALNVEAKNLNENITDLTTKCANTKNEALNDLEIAKEYSLKLTQRNITLEEQLQESNDTINKLKQELSKSKNTIQQQELKLNSLMKRLSPATTISTTSKNPQIAIEGPSSVSYPTESPSPSQPESSVENEPMNTEEVKLRKRPSSVTTISTTSKKRQIASEGSSSVPYPTESPSPSQLESIVEDEEL